MLIHFQIFHHSKIFIILHHQDVVIKTLSRISKGRKTCVAVCALATSFPPSVRETREEVVKDNRLYTIYLRSLCSRWRLCVYVSPLPNWAEQRRRSGRNACAHDGEEVELKRFWKQEAQVHLDCTSRIGNLTLTYGRHKHCHYIVYSHS